MVLFYLHVKIHVKCLSLLLACPSPSQLDKNLSASDDRLSDNTTATKVTIPVVFDFIENINVYTMYNIEIFSLCCYPLHI